MTVQDSEARGYLRGLNSQTADLGSIDAVFVLNVEAWSESIGTDCLPKRNILKMISKPKYYQSNILKSSTASDDLWIRADYRHSGINVHLYSISKNVFLSHVLYTR